MLWTLTASAGTSPSEGLQAAQNVAQVADAPFPWLLAGLCVGLGAFLGGGLTEIAKRTILARLEGLSKARGLAAGKADAPWWMPLLGLVSTCIGAGVGAAVGAIDWSAGYGAALGAVGGVQPVWVLKVVKGVVERKAEGV